MHNHKPKTLPIWIINATFLLGITAATCFRLIIIVQHFDTHFVRLLWYIGVIGYIFFFSYRYYIALKRKHAISAYHLLERIQTGAPFSSEERAVTHYILSSIVKSREHWNYLYIFVLSLLAVLADILLSIKG